MILTNFIEETGLFGYLSDIMSISIASENQPSHLTS